MSMIVWYSLKGEVDKVRVAEGSDVADLRKKIKEENPNDLQHVDARNLLIKTSRTSKALDPGDTVAQIDGGKSSKTPLYVGYVEEDTPTTSLTRTQKRPAPSSFATGCKEGARCFLLPASWSPLLVPDIRQQLVQELKQRGRRMREKQSAGLSEGEFSKIVETFDANQQQDTISACLAPVLRKLGLCGGLNIQAQKFFRQCCPDLSFMQNEALRGIGEVKGTDEGFPEAQAAEGAAHILNASKQRQRVLCICLTKSRAIRVGVVVRLEKAFQGRSHCYVDLASHSSIEDCLGRKLLCNALRIMAWELLSEDSLQVKARINGSSESLAVVGFSQRVIRCAKDGVVYAVKPLPGVTAEGATLMVECARTVDPEQCLDWKCGTDDSAQELQILLSKWVQSDETITGQELLRVVQHLEQRLWQGLWVHGDLRLGYNVLFTQDSHQPAIIDWDFAGRQGTATYPTSLNREVFADLCPNGRVPQRDEVIHPYMDKYILLRQIQKLLGLDVEWLRTNAAQPNAMLPESALCQQVTLPVVSTCVGGNSRYMEYEEHRLKRRRTSG